MAGGERYEVVGPAVEERVETWRAPMCRSLRLAKTRSRAASSTAPSWGFAQHVPAAPHRLQVVLAVRGIGEFLAQLADEHVNDLLFGFVEAAIKMVEKHFLCQRGALVKAQEFEQLVLPSRQVHGGAVDLDALGVEIQHKIAGPNYGLGGTRALPGHMPLEMVRPFARQVKLRVHGP